MNCLCTVPLQKGLWLVLFLDRWRGLRVSLCASLGRLSGCHLTESMEQCLGTMQEKPLRLGLSLSERWSLTCWCHTEWHLERKRVIREWFVCSLWFTGLMEGLGWNVGRSVEVWREWDGGMSSVLSLGAYPGGNKSLEKLLRGSYLPCRSYKFSFWGLPFLDSLLYAQDIKRRSLLKVD